MAFTNSTNTLPLSTTHRSILILFTELLPRLDVKVVPETLEANKSEVYRKFKAVD
jgi:hypothetical protein